MKIIDSQGKLFGWINIIDCFAIILLLIIIQMFFLGHQLYLANKQALAQVRQEERLREVRTAEAQAKAEVLTKKTIKDRLYSLEKSQMQIDQRLEALERSVGGKIYKKNFSP